jgi:hypothetical protein
MQVCMTPPNLADIERCLSPDRWARFSGTVAANGGEAEDALRLYAWQARVMGGFWPLLQCAEVVTRNAVTYALQASFGASWLTNQAWLKTLPSGGRKPPRAVFHELWRKYKAPSIVVANSEFWLWEHLLSARYEPHLWAKHFAHAFPGAAERGVSRQTLADQVEKIRRFRNRIAHHDQIVTLDLRALHQSALDVIRSVSPSFCAWAQSEFEVLGVIDRRPSCMP